MTQVIACSTTEGILLATDSLATWFDRTGARKHFNLKKILRLGSHTAMVSAGIGIGVEMGLAFQEFLRERSVEGIEEVLRFAPPFFTDRYVKFLRERGRNLGLFRPSVDEESDETSPWAGVYFILAGYSFKDRQRPYHLCLLGSEENGDSITVYSSSPTLLIPRSLSMEKRLEAQRLTGSSLGHLLSLCKSFLKKRSADGEVGPPYYFATITRVGFREMMEEEVEG
jgi:20S proteasome alpha/beta subunit